MRIKKTIVLKEDDEGQEHIRYLKKMKDKNISNNKKKKTHKNGDF